MDIATVISMVESSGNPRAMRFEPKAYAEWPWSDTMTTIQAKHACSEGTARMIACTSWGQFQILGENIFSKLMQSYQVNPTDVFGFVGDLGLQERAFHAFLQIHGINFSLDEILSDAVKMQRFARFFNGPGATDAYIERVHHYATIA